MNITPTLKLTCRHCDWQPADTLTMRDVLAHYSEAHGSAETALNLSAVCSCGTIMDLKESIHRPRQHGFEDRFRCFSCGNTGTVFRRE